MSEKNKHTRKELLNKFRSMKQEELIKEIDKIKLEKIKVENVLMNNTCKRVAQIKEMKVSMRRTKLKLALANTILNQKVSGLTK